MKTQILFLTLVAATLLGSCTKEIAPDSEGIASPSEFVSVTLPLQLAATDATPPSAMSKSPAAGNPSEGFSVSLTEATATDAPSTRTISRELTNVWVLQFDSTGKNVSTTNTGTLAPGALLTAPSLQVGTGCTIYVVANGVASGLTTSYPSTLTQFGSMMLHTDAVTDATKLPLSGKLTNVTVENLGDGKGKIRVPSFGPPTIVLSRIHAEVTLTVDFGVMGYTLLGAELYNVPVGSTYGWNTATATFPDNAMRGNFSYTDLETSGLTPVSTSTSGTKTTYKWFIGDNRRGEVADLNTPGDRNKDKAPAYATFARITISGAMYLYYDIYLGSGEVANFDVKRNMTYTQTATIKGFGAFHEALPGTDARVSSKRDMIWLTDNVDDSPFRISFKHPESPSMISWDLAEQYCRQLGSGWYLPAQAQLMLMWIYLDAIPSGERPASGYYWSGTERSDLSSYAWYVSLSHGHTYPVSKSYSEYVRCVREN